MRIGVNRPNFCPWLGFMALVDWVDTFVVLDNILISNSASFFLRNRIKDPNGEARWFGVSKQKGGQSQILVKDVQLANTDWREALVRRLQTYYRKAPYQSEVAPKIIEALHHPEPMLAKYNTHLLEVLCELLNIETQFVYASEIMENHEGDAQSRIIQLCLNCGGDEYYNGRDGIERGLYDGASFEKYQIKLFKQNYQHPNYHQGGTPFQAYLSVVDLLMHCGKESLAILRSGQTWERV